MTNWSKRKACASTKQEPSKVCMVTGIKVQKTSSLPLNP